MPRTHPFTQVDVFSSQPYLGNPVAVLGDAEGIATEAMQQIAAWTNLSETTFLLPPTTDSADYRVRIFTPTGELPFAGHPTLGSARAWLSSGGQPRVSGQIVQECAAGLISLRHEQDELSFAAPPPLRTGPLDEKDLAPIVRAFGVSPDRVIGHQWVDNGPGWAVLRLTEASDVLALEPDLSLIPDAMVGAVGAYPAGSPQAFELRAFAPRVNVPEDPVCGSLNASVAQWLTSTDQAPDRYRVSQGRRVGRAGEITITVEDGTVWVGGATTVCFSGVATV